MWLVAKSVGCLADRLIFKLEDIIEQHIELEDFFKDVKLDYFKDFSIENHDCARFAYVYQHQVRYNW